MKSNPLVQKSINQEKLTKQLEFITSTIDLAKKLGFRLVLSGGFGIDFFLGQVTRDHNDVDLILYGDKSREYADLDITHWANNLLNRPTVKIKSEKFYEDINIKSQGLVINLYYVQTVFNPYKDLKHIITLDGSKVKNSLERFPLPSPGLLNGITVEVDDPNQHLADILYKRQKLENRKSHDRDIQNLRLVTDTQKVNKIIHLM